MKQAIIIFFAALAVYTLSAGGHLYSPDEEILFRVTQSLWEEGDLSIRQLGGTGFATMRGTDGQEYAQYGVGQAILALPFYGFGKMIAGVTDAAGWRRIYGIPPNEPDGARDFAYTPAEIAPRFMCSFFNIVISALLASVMYLLMLMMVKHHGASLMVTMLYAFGTLAWPHSRAFFTETAAVFFIVFAWFSLWRMMHSTEQVWMMTWAFIAGAATGFAALVRQDSVLLYPGLALVMLGPVRIWEQEHKPRVHPYILFCIPALVCGAVMLGLNWAHFGGPFKSGYTDQPEGVKFSTPLIAGLYGFMFSAGKGVFFFSPPLVLNFWSWCAMAKRGKWAAFGALISVLIPLIVMAKWQNWAGGWCWGPRHIVMIHPFLAIPCVFWLIRFWRWMRRSACLALLAVGIFVQLIGVSQDFILFHRVKYRNPAEAYRVLYDDFDQQYWGQQYRLLMPDVSGQWRDAPLGQMPAPIQHSLYIPQSSVWNGYPEMWRMGYRDNLWLRLMGGE